MDNRELTPKDTLIFNFERKVSLFDLLRLAGVRLPDHAEEGAVFKVEMIPAGNGQMTLTGKIALDPKGMHRRSIELCSVTLVGKKDLAG